MNISLGFWLWNFWEVDTIKVWPGNISCILINSWLDLQDFDSENSYLFECFSDFCNCPLSWSSCDILSSSAEGIKAYGLNFLSSGDFYCFDSSNFNSIWLSVSFRYTFFKTDFLEAAELWKLDPTILLLPCIISGD